MFASFSYMDVLAYLQAQYAADLAPTPERPYGRQLQIQPYAYPINFGDVAANANVTQSLQITANADFLWLDTWFTSESSAIDNYRVMLQNASSGEKYMQTLVAPIRWGSVVTVQNQMPAPVWLPGKSAIIANLIASATADEDCVITLFGALVRLQG